jgi:hypothetical protein
MADHNATRPTPQQLATKDRHDPYKQYRNVQIGDGGMHGDIQAPADETWKMTHPVALLELITETPAISLIIKRVLFIPGDGYWYDTLTNNTLKSPKEVDDEWSHDFYGLPEDQEKLESLPVHPVDLLAFELTTEEKTQWRSLIDIGHQSATFAACLCLLPALEDLQLGDRGAKWMPYLNKVFKHAATVPSTKVLAQLKEVYIYHDDTEGCEDLDAVDEVMFIPSLRKLRGQQLGNEYGEQEYVCPPGSANRVSNIEEIDFISCGLNGDDITELLKPMVNLKKMDFEAYQDWAYIYGFKGGSSMFRRRFHRATKAMFEERGLVWKADRSTVKIRKKGLNDAELGDVESLDGLTAVSDDEDHERDKEECGVTVTSSGGVTTHAIWFAGG